MRTLDATLQAAMDTGTYVPYFLITVRDNYTLDAYLSGTPVGYELKDLELMVKVQSPSYLDVPFYRTSVVLTRGVTISGVNYTLSTSDFVIIDSTWDGSIQTFNCNIVPSIE